MVTCPSCRQENQADARFCSACGAELGATAAHEVRKTVTLHELFAGWLDGRGEEFEEIVGYHLEQAYRWIAELGPVDDRGRALAERAAERIAASARRAQARGDGSAAAHLFERAASATAAGFVELLAGDAAAAEHELRPACEELERIGELGYLASAAPDLLDALYLQGRDEEALRLSERWFPERLTVREDVDAQVGWRRARAKLLARHGDVEQAERLARDATAMAGRTDYLDRRAHAVADLAEVLRMADRPEESAAELEEAIRLYERKGNVAAAGTLRSLLAEPPLEV